MIEKLISTEEEYESALDELDELLILNPNSETPEANKLEILSLVINAYESERYPQTFPDPIEAIKFRMEQGGLNQRDLIPFIGSRNRVAEILSGKRKLTLRMIRALHIGLGIPAQALLKDQTQITGDEESEWAKYPCEEMANRGWIKASKTEIRSHCAELSKQFFSKLESLGQFKVPAKSFRHSTTLRSARSMDFYALHAWTAKVYLDAQKTQIPINKEFVTINKRFMRDIARLSVAENGPRLAQEHLRRSGISLIVCKRLKRTYLDGAVIFGKRPVIGMTLRHDRLDNFWFTLMHELAHIALHNKEEHEKICDDLEYVYSSDPREKEADALAQSSLIPSEVWRRSRITEDPSPEAVKSLAREFGINSAIVAGRVRFELENYRILSKQVGYHKVRDQFPEYHQN